MTVKLHKGFCLPKPAFCGVVVILSSFQHRENADAAVQDFSSIIRLSPGNPDGWIKRAEVLFICSTCPFIHFGCFVIVINVQYGPEIRGNFLMY